MPISEVQEEEIKQLTKLMDERRAANVKGAYPVKVRQRIIDLRNSGVPMRVLSQRLGIATSMLYGWGKNEVNGAPSDETPAQVLQVEPAPRSATREPAGVGELRLQLGTFAITVSLVEA